jgi:hypothetical protein
MIMGQDAIYGDHVQMVVYIAEYRSKLSLNIQQVWDQYRLKNNVSKVNSTTIVISNCQHVNQIKSQVKK